MVPKTHDPTMHARFARFVSIALCVSFLRLSSMQNQRLHYMTVHGMQQQLQSSVLMHEHLPP
ncbi:hypothetical protein IQ07DRAFT_585695 [Pyrenochaeta sp. DS3sAY3a]|nr:hypothetical protein IQ07DRAFT_585695 [Pyrenochaeta sp. DS3sAY3a]